MTPLAKIRNILKLFKKYNTKHEFATDEGIAYDVYIHIIN